MTTNVVCLFFLTIAGCLGVRDVVMIAPEAIRAGSNLVLACPYELDTAPLYSIKFYLADREFYRYVPKESPPTRVFSLPGLRVDLHRSNDTVVYLERVRKELSGFYKCEVSDDAPFFHTVIRAKQVVITEEPIFLPELRVDKSKYTLGERIRANCSSRSGFPAANLTFYINNFPIRSTEGSRLWSDVEAERTGLESSRLEMEMIASAYMFRDTGRAKLSCSASQFTLYSRTVSTFIFEDTPQLAHVLGPSSPNKGLGLNRSSSQVIHSSVMFLTIVLTILAVYSS